MATLYPQCGLNARELDASEITAAGLRKVLVSSVVAQVPLRDRRRMLYCADAVAKKLNINKRVTTLLRTHDADVLRAFAGGVIRGHAVILAEHEYGVHMLEKRKQKG